MKEYLKKIVTMWIIFFPVFSFADAEGWSILPANSSITFIATQNNAPVSGKFTQFTGDIHFDPAQLKTSHVRIVVDMASVTTDYADVANTLKTADWFNIAAFPQAVFTASDFTKTGNKSYQANGTLTIRDKSVPAVITFTLDEFSETKARVQGSILLKRLSFGIGQGEWQKTDTVKDEVEVQFKVTAVRK